VIAVFRLTLANALAHRSRLALTWLAVVLGVAFAAGGFTLTETSNRLLDEQFRTAAADVDLTVRDAAAFDSGMGVEVERDPLDPDVVKHVSTHPAVAEARPAVSGQGLLSVRGDAVVPKGPTVLASWAAPPFSAYTLRSGRAPTGPGKSCSTPPPLRTVAWLSETSSRWLPSARRSSPSSGSPRR
jgi:putative ABC transport system permease protein